MTDLLLLAVKQIISLYISATFGHPGIYQQPCIGCRWLACMESGSRGLG